MNCDIYISGTVIYKRRYIGEVLVSFPYLYVNKDEVYELADSTGGETFEEYDGSRVRIFGHVFVNSETDTRMINALETTKI